jgi:hypothetical protein
MARRVTGYDLVRIGAGDVYYRDGLYTNHNHNFIQDPDFALAYSRAVAGTTGDPKDCHGEWRTHIAIWAAQNALKLQGDFVECGVFLGFISSALMTAMRWNETAGQRRYFLVDNFEGVVPSLLSDEEKKLGRAEQYGEKYSSTYQRAKTNLSEFKNTEIIKGNVPDVLASVKTDRVAFLHLDMNAATPEVEALRFFWPKIVPGGIALLDDYAFAGYEPQQEALDALAIELGTSIASLPTGQGLILKH